MKIVDLVIDTVAGLLELACDHPFLSLLFWTGMIVLARMAGHNVNGMWFVPLIIPVVAVVDKSAHPRH